MQHMYMAGCESIWIGVESGSPKVLKDMDKGETLEQIEKAFKIARKLGMKTRAYFLLGMPSETIRDIGMTEECADRIQADEVGFTILAPYPGTDFYDKEKHRDVDWSMVDMYENDLCVSNHMTNKELKERRDYLTMKFEKKLVFHHGLVDCGN